MSRLRLLFAIFVVVAGVRSLLINPQYLSVSVPALPASLGDSLGFLRGRDGDNVDADDDDNGGVDWCDAKNGTAEKMAEKCPVAKCVAPKPGCRSVKGDFYKNSDGACCRKLCQVECERERANEEEEKAPPSSSPSPSPSLNPSRESSPPTSTSPPTSSSPEDSKSESEVKGKGKGKGKDKDTAEDWEEEGQIDVSNHTQNNGKHGAESKLESEKAAENKLMIERKKERERDRVKMMEIKDIAASSDTQRHKKLLTALHWFEQKSTAFNISYSLAYGSLLGYIQGRDIIAHDTDLDLELGTDAIAKLRKAMSRGDNDVFDQANHGEIPLTRPVMLVRLQNHMLHFDHVKRYDCHGVPHAKQTDGCGFSGPLARVMFGLDTYIDVYYRCGFVKNAPKSWHCRTSTMDCSYCTSGQGLRTLPFTPTPCKFGPVTTKCPPKKYAHDRLRRIYGDTYMTPNKNYDYDKVKRKAGR